MRLLRGIFVQHAGLKIGAVVIATLLWVVYNSEPVVETAYSAPLLLVNVPSGMQITGDVPSAVIVRLRGRLNHIRRVDADGLTVTADCSQAHPGSQLVPLVASHTPELNGPEVISVVPESIPIYLVPASAPPAARK